MWTIDRLKRQALLWHLVFSLVLTIAIATWLLLHWFPAPFSFAAGALTGLIIVVSVDFCLGPMLTLLLIHSKKSRRENILDGLVIVLLQLSALSYGLWQVSLARPAAIVFWQDSFYMVKAFDYHERFGKQPDLSKYSDAKIPLIYARYPLLLSDLQQLEQRIRDGVVPYEQIELYQPVSVGLAEIARSPVNIQILREKHPELQSQLDSLGDAQAQKDFIYSRLHSEFGTFILVLDANGTVQGLFRI